MANPEKAEVQERIREAGKTIGQIMRTDPLEVVERAYVLPDGHAMKPQDARRVGYGFELEYEDGLHIIRSEGFESERDEFGVTPSSSLLLESYRESELPDMRVSVGSRTRVRVKEGILGRPRDISVADFDFDDRYLDLWEKAAMRLSPLIESDELTS